MGLETSSLDPIGFWCLAQFQTVGYVLCMSDTAETAPNWDRLFEVAVGQEGHFTTEQAATAGYSTQLLFKYLKNGRVTRVRRGVYRIVHFPAGEHEDLATLWLWSERSAVFSHETALMLHNLSDALPRKATMTLPLAWAKRRLRVPKGVIVHHADIPKKERIDIGAVPVTASLRTLLDCVAAHVSPELVDAAIKQARSRGLITATDVCTVRAKARFV
jgi:predicted transcriptional regulator of viral defense system